MKVIINGVIEKESQAGKTYWEVQTNKGDMSAFDLPIVEKLREAWKNNTEINVDAKPSKDNKYMNIRGILSDGDKSYDTPEKQERYDRDSAQYEEMNSVQTIPIQTWEKQVDGKYKDITEQARKSVKGSAYEKDPTGLAVEVFNGIVPATGDEAARINTMQIAINLVKQAQKAFS